MFGNLNIFTQSQQKNYGMQLDGYTNPQQLRRRKAMDGFSHLA